MCKNKTTLIFFQKKDVFQNRVNNSVIVKNKLHSVRDEDYPIDDEMIFTFPCLVRVI